jgi:hypothetical protein
MGRKFRLPVGTPRGQINWWERARAQIRAVGVAAVGLLTVAAKEIQENVIWIKQHVPPQAWMGIAIGAWVIVHLIETKREKNSDNSPPAAPPAPPLGK